MIIDKSNINQFINGTKMRCSRRGVTSIEFIPDHITELYCYNNKLTELPPLPNGLIHLSCWCNKLTELPLLPNLEYLYCWDNPLINGPTKPLSNWIIQHNRSNRLKQLLNENR